MVRNNRHCLFTDILCGLAAGAAATWIMDKVSAFGYQLEDERTRKYEGDLRHNEYPPGVLVQKLAKACCGSEPDQETKQKLATRIHWGYGIFWGGVFGALRDRAPLFGVACGLAFGAGLWLIGDEILMPAMGLTPPSREFPWQNHARAAANHLAYGGALGVTHGLLRKSRLLMRLPHHDDLPSTRSHPLLLHEVQPAEERLRVTLLIRPYVGMAREHDLSVKEI